MRPRPAHDHSGAEPCRPDCPYRRLYEGSQQSLAEMTTARAAVVAKHGELRRGVLDLMRRFFPQPYLEAERQARRPLAEMDDGVVLAYLSTFLHAVSGIGLTGEELPGITQLRRALTEAGIALPRETNFSVWAEAITSVRQLGQGGSLPGPGSDDGGSTWSDLAGSSRTEDTFEEVYAPAADRMPNAVSSPPRPAQPNSIETRRVHGAPEAPTTTNVVPAIPIAPDVPPPRARVGNRDPLVSDPGDGPRAPRRQPLVAPAPHSPAAASGELDDLFDDGPPLPDEPPPEELASNEAAYDLEDLFTDTDLGSVPGGTDLESLLFGETGEGPGGTATQRGGASTRTAAPEGSGPPPALDDPRQIEGQGRAANAKTPDRPGAAGHQKTGLQAPVRPQLFPEGGGLKPARGKRKAAPKVARASAVPPDPAVEETEQSGGGDLDAVLQTAVQVPRPVFGADLAELVGGSEAVAAWEERVRATRSPIRFVASAGRRHQDLGSLVLPYPKIDAGVPTEFQRSLWGKLIASYRGGRLYELGVVVRRYGEDVVSSEVTSEAVTLRLTQKRGLVGMVLATSTDLSPESKGAGALVDTVDTLLSERLAAIVVLVLGGDKLEPAITAISEAARSRNWRPLMPVIAACSYEYVKDENGSSTLVLG